jgi:DNA-binding CsgD family transcriptional regulator
MPYTSSMESLTKIYFKDGWHLRDTRSLMLAKRPMHLAAFGDEDFFGTEEWNGLIHHDSYFNDFLGIQRLRYGAWIQFNSANKPWIIALQRTITQGAFERADIARLQPLARALAEVGAISAAVGHAVLAGTLDALSLVGCPAVAIDRTGRVLGTNVAADGSFDSSIRISNSRLKVTDERAHQTLEAVFARLRLSPETARLPIDAVAVRRLEKPPIILRILPVPVAARSPFLGARALLVFREPCAPSIPNMVALAAALNFTPAEAKLAKLLGAGQSLESAAQELQLSRETIRTQLKSLFAKTDTHRQGELIALLTRF